jgi:(4S)-4-hydroxy-5-phosphonooxypentane-2,3-dione isomerase
MSAIVLHVELTLNPDKRDAYLARAQQHRENVRANESACQRFEISVEEDNANLVRLYEVYDDQAAVEHHMQTPYMIAYREETAPMIADRKLTRAIMVHD